MSLTRSCYGTSTNGQQVTIAAFTNNTFYVLNYYAGSSFTGYFLDPDFFTQATTPSGPIFVNNTNDNKNWTLVDIGNNNYIVDQTDASSNVYVGFVPAGSVQNITITVSQSSYANWDAPSTFLCDVGYTLGSSNFIYSTGYNQDGSPKIQTDYLSAQALFYPSTTYYNCNATQSMYLSGLQVTANAWCANGGSSTTCAPLPVTSWTDDILCVDNVLFTYCNTGQTCGTDNCNGPCSSTNTLCTFDNTNFACKTTSIYKEPWFIILVIILIVLLIFIIFVFFF